MKIEASQVLTAIIKQRKIYTELQSVATAEIDQAIALECLELLNCLSADIFASEDRLDHEAARGDMRDLTAEEDL